RRRRRRLAPRPVLTLGRLLPRRRPTRSLALGRPGLLMRVVPEPAAVTAVPRNTAWLFGGRVLAQALAVGLTVLLAARLGVAGLGQYALVSAVVLLANVGTTFGTDMVLIREIAGQGRLDRWAP